MTVTVLSSETNETTDSHTKKFSANVYNNNKNMNIHTNTLKQIKKQTNGV